MIKNENFNIVIYVALKCKSLSEICPSNFTVNVVFLKKFFHTSLRSTYPSLLQSKSSPTLNNSREWLSYTPHNYGVHIFCSALFGADCFNSQWLGKLLSHGWTVYRRMVQASHYPYTVDIHVTLVQFMCNLSWFDMAPTTTFKLFISNRFLF